MQAWVIARFRGGGGCIASYTVMVSKRQLMFIDDKVSVRVSMRATSTLKNIAAN